MNTIPQTVAASSATADIAYYVCVVSFFIAGGVAIYLLWDRIQHHKKAGSGGKVVRPSKKRASVKKAVASKKTAAKRAPAKRAAAKKPAKRTAKRK